MILSNDACKKPSVLITGANGFVGRSLCARMVADGWNVKGAIRSLPKESDLPSGTVCATTRAIDANTDWSKALNRIDTVIHLAARVHEMHEDALTQDDYNQVNVDGTVRLAQMAANSGVKRFIFLSSVKVNGEGRSFPYLENDEVSPSDYYGISKWEGEKKLKKISLQTNLEAIVIRPPLVYGPGVKANFLRLMKLVDRELPIPLSSVKNLRSMIALDNLVDFILHCAKIPEVSYDVFFVSDDEDLSTPELIRRIASLMGRRARLLPFPPGLLRLVGRITGKEGMVDRLCGSLQVDISKAKQLLGWKPPVTVDEGLSRTVSWYMKQKAND